MKRHLLVALAAVLAVGISASAARAQCAFQHPKKAKKIQGSLIQAFVSCNNPGGNTPNNTTQGGIPACSPPETYSNQAGNHDNGGWVWGPKSSGSVAFKALKVCRALSTGATGTPPCDPASPLNTNDGSGPNAADISVDLKLADVHDAATGDLITGVQGTLATLSRGTLNDNDNGDQTVIDFSLQFQFDMLDGAAKMKTSADAGLNKITNHGLPPCTAVEVVAIRVLDANNDQFGSLGTFLPLP